MGEETAVVPAAREKGEGQVSEPRDGAKLNAAPMKGATALAVVLVVAGFAGMACFLVGTVRKTKS